MLSRSTQVGEFYVMRPPPFPPKAGVTGFMDIFLYDEEGDRHVRISWSDALKATGAEGFMAGAKKNTPMPDVPAFETGPVDKTGKAPGAGSNAAGNFEAWYGHAKWLESVNKSGLPETDYADYKTAYELKKDIYIVIAKPFIEHLMHSAIAMVSGRDTGATLFGPAGENPTPLCASAPSDPPRAPRRHADLRQHPGQDDRGEWRRSAHQQSPRARSHHH